MRIGIIGAGLVGSAIAAALARRGADVTVVAADRLGADTSQASLSWLNAANKPPRAYTQMNLDGMRRHAEFAAASASAPWYHRGGHLRLARTPTEAESWQRTMQELAAFDYPSRWLTRAELSALEPDLDLSSLGAAEVAFFPEEAWIQGAPLIGRLLADARAARARVVCPAEIVGFRTADGRIRTLRLSEGTDVPVDCVVNAAGARAFRISAMVGADLPMTNEIGLQVYTEPAAIALGRVVQSERLNLRPDGGGRICLHDFGTDGDLLPRGGATTLQMQSEAAAWTVPDAAVERLLSRLAEHYPATRGIRAEGARLGLRPIPHDRRPVIGWFDACPNLYSAVMHSGATQCLWVGDLVADEILGGLARAELASFRPSRFPAAT